MTEQEFRISLGAYVLGALEPGETKDVEQHLRTCADCQLEYLELAEMLGALAIVPPDMVAAGLRGNHPPDPYGSPPAGPVPVAQRDELSARRTRPARPRRWRAVTAAAVAAAAVLVAGSVGVTMLVARPSNPSTQAQGGSVTPPAVRTLTATNPMTAISAVVTLRSDGTGTYLDGLVTGDLMPGWRCQLFAVPKWGGDAEPSGSARVDHRGGSMHISGSVPLPTNGIARIELRRGGGKIDLLDLPL